MKQEIGHMQIICTLLQTDNLTSTLSCNFYGPNALPAVSVKALKAKYITVKFTENLFVKH